MRHTKDVVETSMGLRSEGLSLRRTRIRTHKIKKVLVRSNQTILNWFVKFGKRPVQALKNLKPRLFGDETKVRMWKKGLFFWLWALRCEASQPVGWHVSQDRDMHETKMLMWEARRRFPVGYWPEAIRTDKMPAYEFAIHSVLGHAVKHEKVISFRHGNNVIENFWRCKSHFPRFRTLENARLFINHWMWENFGDDSFFWLFRHTFIRHNRLHHSA